MVREVIDLAYSFVPVTTGDTLITVKKANHEDFIEVREDPWKYPEIPSGSFVTFKNVIRNFQGKFLTCEYKGSMYKLNPMNLDKP